jgi:hypothetical protein
MVIGVHCCALGVAQAQIRYLTVQAPHSPAPGLLPAPAAAPAPQAQIQPQPIAPPAPVVRPTTVPIKPSLTKDELDKRVVAFQKQRAEEGSASAQYQLALRYLNGDGVEKDLQAARKWLSAAAREGSSEAKSKLAQLNASPR